MASQPGSFFSAVVLVIGVLGTALWVSGHPPAAPARTIRLGAVLPTGDSYSGSWWWYPSLALSPDGTRIAYIASRAGVRQLYLRDIDAWDGKPVPGTENAHTPFFSPDGKWLGAVVGRKIIKVPVAGGPVSTITTAPYQVYGASWSTNGWIYFGTEAPLGLLKVQAQGFTVFEVIRFEPKTADSDHRFPEIMPGGEYLLITARKGPQASFDDADIESVSLKTDKRTVLIKGGTNPRYLSSGHLLFMRAGVLMAVGFDAQRMQVKGTPVPVVEGVLENPRTGAGQYSISADGSLAYLTGGATFGEHELVAVDRSGATRVLGAHPRPYSDLSLSPDGRSIATTVEGEHTGVWIHDIGKDTDTLFTPEGERRAPIWSGDGKRLFYSGYKPGEWVIYGKPLDGSKKEEELSSQETPAWPRSWTRDDQRMVFDLSTLTGAGDTWLHDSTQKAREMPFLATAANEGGAQISPDGKWVAFESDESGRMEIYVSDFPQLKGKTRVSSDGGVRPRWSADGRELFYRMDSRSGWQAPLAQSVKLMAASIETSQGFKAGTPHVLFAGPFFENGNDYAVMPDGKSFVFLRESQASGPNDMRMVVNWAEELKHRVTN